MNVMVVGAEGREHALVWEIVPSPLVKKIICLCSEIQGLEEVEGMNDVMVFHEGTRREGDARVNAGGRAFGVTTQGDTTRDEINLAYEAVDKISWDGAYYRKDIGFKALKGGE